MMRKDRECLRSMIQRRIDNLPSTYEGLYIEGSRDAYELVLQDIDQLDEPEVLSQEWIDKNKTSIDRKLDGTPIYKVREELLQNLLVPKQEELESKIKVLIEAYKQEDGAYSNPENGWISGFVEDLENLVEEEPLYYALIKGHELIAGEDACKYWKCDMRNGGMFLSNRYSQYGRYLAEMSENDWGKFGINESNADFVEVEEN